MSSKKGQWPLKLDIFKPCHSKKVKPCHLRSLISLRTMFASVVDVLEMITTILVITNELSETLQRKDQDIVKCDEAWNHVAQTNMHHYRVDFFYNVIDMQMQELNARFNETNIELLLCVACLNPCDSFFAFDKDKLNRLALFYPRDFSSVNLVILDDQLDNYIIDMRSTHEFLDLKRISELAHMIVRKRKDKVYPLVYLLITLALLLPVATAIVERVFSHMKMIKNQLRNRMGDEFLNDSMLVHIEKDIFDNINNEVVIQRFQNMKRRRMEVNKIG